MARFHLVSHRDLNSRVQSLCQCLELKARKVGDSQGLYGIMFGFKDPKNHYLYMVDPFGNYKLERIVDGKAIARIDWKYSYKLNKGNHTNNLRIVVDTANNVNLYANGELIHTVLAIGSLSPYNKRAFS